MKVKLLALTLLYAATVYSADETHRQKNIQDFLRNARQVGVIFEQRVVNNALKDRRMRSNQRVRQQAVRLRQELNRLLVSWPRNEQVVQKNLLSLLGSSHKTFLRMMIIVV